MPSVSKKQQNFFRLVKAYKDGKIKGKKVSQSVKDAANGMTKKQISDFADHRKRKYKVKKLNEMFPETNEKLKIIPLTDDEFRNIPDDTEFVDLGLPSGNLWTCEDSEETYTFPEAFENGNLPSVDDYKELFAECEKEDNGNSITFKGRNGRKITFSKEHYFWTSDLTKEKKWKDIYRAADMNYLSFFEKYANLKLKTHQVRKKGNRI